MADHDVLVSRWGWPILVGISGALLAIVLIGFAIWAVGFFLLGIWAIYRIAKGWMTPERSPGRIEPDR